MMTSDLMVDKRFLPDDSEASSKSDELPDTLALQVAKHYLSILTAMCPQPGKNKYATGNLLSTLTARVIDNNTVIVEMGGERAPYAKYTTEPWSQFKPPLQGHQNPNEGWFDRAVKQATDVLTETSGVKIEVGEHEFAV